MQVSKAGLLLTFVDIAMLMYDRHGTCVDLDTAEQGHAI